LIDLEDDVMLAIRRTGLIALALLSVQSQGAFAQTSASAKPYQVEWVYRVKYGFQDEWWRLFQKYQIAALDEEQRRGYVKSYIVVRPGLHTSEDARWDYRIVITYTGYEGSLHEGEVEKALFPDVAARNRDEDRRWELTTNHWDLPIHEIDPHVAAE
jgi:hypothetical protein